MDVKQKIEWAVYSIIYGLLVGNLAVAGYLFSYNILLIYWLEDSHIFLFIKAILFSAIILSFIFVSINFIFNKITDKIGLKKNIKGISRYGSLAFEAGGLVGSAPISIYYLRNYDEYIGFLFSLVLLMYIFAEYAINFIMKYDAFREFRGRRA